MRHRETTVREERLFELVKDLTELPGPIGREEPVLRYLQTSWSDRVDRLERVGIGNLVARINSRGPKLLIDAHADEICLMVQSITPGGFLRVSAWNRHPERIPGWLYPVGQPALVVGRRGIVDGVFATQTGHVASGRAEQEGAHEWSDIFIDIGAASDVEARAWGVQVGDRAIWNPPTRRLGHYISGKAMDDRAALAIMTLLLEEVKAKELSYEVSFSVTVQEENGYTGALSLCLREGFDWAIALDVGLSGDLPASDQDHMPVRLGGGPVLVHKDEVHYDPELTGQLADHAEAMGIRVQHAIFHNYGSDGGAYLRQGVRTALLAFPCRYTHSAFETVSLPDLLQTVDLMKRFLTGSS
jgi:endoglucanase